jgi:hypothetical protein
VGGGRVGPGVGIPKVGAGLGKLSWQDEVKPLFEEMLAPGRCPFVAYEGFSSPDEQAGD